MKQVRNRRKQKQINLLNTNVRKRHSRKQVAGVALWSFGIMTLLIVLAIGLHVGIAFTTSHLLYDNPRYNLRKIVIAPEGLSDRAIRQAAGLELGRNLWTLNLSDIKGSLEKLSYVASARVERHFPDRINIVIRERQPVVKIVGIDTVLGKRMPFYLDRDCMVLLPHGDEQVPLPEVIGLTDAELGPGTQIDSATLRRALEILDAIDRTEELRTSITIRTIDLSKPLSITMTTTHDLAITFRLDYVDQQMVRLQQIFEKFVDKQQRTLRTVDLTPNYNVPITFYE
jgi:cell division septal protein FtsQ